MTPEQQRTNWEHREVIHWLDSLGVMCDCDNGMKHCRKEYCSPDALPHVPCNSCVLVEVGGVRVRAKYTMISMLNDERIYGLVLPAVGVDDE